MGNKILIFYKLICLNDHCEYFYQLNYSSYKLERNFYSIFKLFVYFFKKYKIQYFMLITLKY